MRVMATRPTHKRALLLVDHGSRRQEANANLMRAKEAVQAESPDLIVHVAHMELAEPSVLDGFAACVAEGAEEVVVFPWFLANGRHVREDIPRLAKEAAEKYGVLHRVTSPFGVHPLMAQLALARAELV